MSKTRALTPGVAVTLLALCAACVDAPTAGTSLPAGSGMHTDVSVNDAPTGLPLHVAGEGTTYVTSPAAAVGTAEWSFNAITDASGATHGHFQMKRQRAGFTVDFSGAVTCIGYDPVNNRAWIGGVVTENRSDDPNHSGEIHQVGHDVWFRIADNGKMGDPEADRSSVLGFEGAGGILTSADYCAIKPWTAGNVNAFAVTSGDIRIKAH